MLSSLYQESHRVEYDGDPLATLSEELLLLPEVLSAAGYLTMGVTGGGNVSGKFGFAQGFDRWDDRSRSVVAGTARVLDLLRQIRQVPADRERPIFAFYHTYEVHSPYALDERYHDILGEHESHFEPSTENLLQHVHSAHRNLTREDLDFIRASYDAGVQLTDATLQQLFADLDAIGFLDGALVVVTSDHGEELGEHCGLLHRDFLFDELLCVPLLVSGAGMSPGVVDETAW